MADSVPGRWSVVATEAVLYGPPIALGILVLLGGGLSDIIAGAVLVLWFSWVTFRHIRKVRARGIWPARLEFIQALRQLRPRTVYLHRDDHLIFWRSGMRIAGVPVALLTRFDEDDAAGIAELGEGVVTGTEFRVTPFLLDVVTKPVGDRITTGASGDVEIVPEARRPLPGQVRGFVVIMRMLRAGHLFAEPGELRELAGQIRAAESMDPPPGESEPS